MKPIPFPSKTRPYRVVIPARQADGKRKVRYFKNEKAAIDFCKEANKHGWRFSSYVLPISQADEERTRVLTRYAEEKLGKDQTAIYKAIDHYAKTKLNIRKVTVREAIEEFQAWRKPRKSHSTWRSDSDRLTKLIEAFEYWQLSDLTTVELRKFFDELGTKIKPRSVYKSVNVFFKWAIDYHLIGENPMDQIEPMGEFGVNKEIYDIGTFRRMLRICAGLEPINSGELPTREYIQLLPWLALSGFLGLRSHEAFRTTQDHDALRWTDLYLDREQPFVEIREEIGKNGMRPIETKECLEALKAWLALVPQENPWVCRWTKSTIQKLKAKFTRATKLRWTKNGFRNSWASYLLSINGLAGVGRLALEMGNSEGIAKRHYIRKLLSGSGKAWFDLRPFEVAPSKIVRMQAAG